jgi:hypothetical protein
MGHTEYTTCESVGVDQAPGVTDELHIFRNTDYRMAAVWIGQEVDEMVNVVCVGYPPRLKADANPVQACVEGARNLAHETWNTS